jgi:DNA-binding NtrC family response regulator
MAKLSVLLVSADPKLVRSVEGIIDSIPKLHLQVISRVHDASGVLARGVFPLVLVHTIQKTDVQEIHYLLETISGHGEGPAVLVLAEEHRAEEALHLLRRGVTDYLSRPLDLSRLAYLVDSLTLRMRLIERAPAPLPKSVRRLGNQDPFFYTESADMGRMMEQVLLVAPQETTLLLGGETGTGKTRLARLIHELSPRRDHPCLVVNCGALSESLIESELFGHVRGAFTGADRDRVGKFAAAGQGTLLLDEIDALPSPLQAKFLRAVEERVFEPLGSNKPMPLRARIITASNRSLEQEVGAGRFRSDLFYRLNVVGFYLPPLRERRSIIPHLAAHFVADFSGRSNRPVRGLSDEALAALLNYQWPGNIRELRNVIERAVALCPGKEIVLTDLPPGVCAAADAANPIPSVSPEAAVPDHLDLRLAKGETEAAWIIKALKKHGNNRLRAAAELGISRMTLYKKMHLYGLMGIS